MNDTLTCPSCKARLRVPDGAEGATYTCPRCLGEIKAAATAGGITEEPTPPAPPREPDRPTTGHCPWCSAPIDSSRWRYCPACAEPLHEDRPPRRRDVFDEEVGRDGRRAGWFTITLLSLGVIALIVVGFGALASPVAFGAVLMPLAVLTAIVWAVVYARTRGRPEEMTVGRVARGVVVTIGAIVFGYFVLALVVVSFLLVVCAGGRW